jgi:putative transposase
MLRFLCLFIRLQISLHLRELHKRLLAWTKSSTSSITLGLLNDLPRSKVELLLENVLLWQQLTVLKRPRFQPSDRWPLVLLASKLARWRQVLLIVQPETRLRSHRELFQLFWKHKTRYKGGNKPLAPEVVVLIRQMARENLLWGAERSRGELMKLGIHVGKGSVLKYMRNARPPRSSQQTRLTFLHNHASATWACDFIQVTDVLFRAIFVFVLIELGSRRVVHVAVTRHPTDAWVAQQLREATPFNQAPHYLIRDNDKKYGAHCTAVAAGAGMAVLKTPIAALKADTTCKQFIGSVRRECLDHSLILSQPHLLRVMKVYVAYSNTMRPHQGLQQRIPQPSSLNIDKPSDGNIVALPILGGLHHHYVRKAA